MIQKMGKIILILLFVYLMEIIYTVFEFKNERKY